MTHTTDTVDTTSLDRIYSTSSDTQGSSKTVNIYDDIIYKNSVILMDDAMEYMTVLDSHILELYTETWKFNRVLNVEKIKEIQNCIRDKHILDTVLHMVYNKQENKLIVFDGNHRREALILLNRCESKCIKVCCYIYVLDTEVNSGTSTDKVDEFIVERFKMINQMSPIPDIYYDIIHNLDNNNHLMKKKDIIEEVYIEYKQKFSKFYSTSSKCRKPNFNDTTFKDVCHNIMFTTKQQLLNKLEEINIDKKGMIRSKSHTIQNKCQAYDFYIFS